MEGYDNCGEFAEELRDAFGTRRGGRITEKLLAACDLAPEPSNEATSDFHDILDLESLSLEGFDDYENISQEEREDRFLKEFYDGNTFLNEEVHKPTGRNAFGQIKTFAQEKSAKEVVAWPNEEINNFDSCSMNSAMCCWVTDRVANNGNNNGDCKTPYPRGNQNVASNCIDADPADNTDLCYVDHLRSRQANHVAGGFILYPDDVEGAVHCHGFVWADAEDDESNIYKGNNLFYVSMEDHLRERGYVRNVPGAPMCGCVEQMPTVDRADCTQTSHEYRYSFSYTGNSEEPFVANIVGREVEFNACDGATNNDLLSKYEQMVGNGEITANAEFNDIIVGDGNCETKMDEFLVSKNFVKTR